MKVWLNGEKSRTVHLFDTQSGESETYTVDQNPTKTAGDGVWIGKRMVATYLRADGEIILQAGESAVALGPGVRGNWRELLGGLGSRLAVYEGRRIVLRFRCWMPSRPLFRVVDPSRDYFDEISDDPLAWICELINDPETQHSYRNYKSPDDGPWHLLADSPT